MDCNELRHPAAVDVVTKPKLLNDDSSHARRTLPRSTSAYYRSEISFKIQRDPKQVRAVHLDEGEHPSSYTCFARNIRNLFTSDG
jgi:hypothetical protein